MSVILIKILQFVVSLSLLVMIHEFGHYIAARIFKIRVEKFYIFFNPWFTLYKRKIGNTEYGIGWLPLGGYVSLSGMIDESMNLEQMKQEPQPWEFRTKPAWQRLIVMLAGVMMNVILAIVIYSGMLYAWGESYYLNDNMINGYAFNEEGHKLGFEDGDRILSIDGKHIGKVNEIGSMLLIADDTRHVEVLRAGDTVEFDIPLERLVDMRESGGYKGLYQEYAPFIVENVISESAIAAGYLPGDRIVAIDNQKVANFVEGMNQLSTIKNRSVNIEVERIMTDSLGVSSKQLVTLHTPIGEDSRIGIERAIITPAEITHVEYGFFESIPAGIKRAGNEISSYWDQLKMIVNPDTKLYKEVGGFIAIGNVFPEAWDWQSFWSITALISIMLAVMNLLPIPGLDGGHALFTLWEIITRRKPSDKFMEVMQWIGLALLLALLVYANGNDILKLFN
ncbi:MAG: RIP metalloprotease RseP [Alistipes sp.]|nr:RIP metalloprotease RseP [Alistipes sp.]